MKQSSKPDREVVRSWMHQRSRENRPPPSLEEIRRQLGWHMVEVERGMTNRRTR